MMKYSLDFTAEYKEIEELVEALEVIQLIKNDINFARNFGWAAILGFFCTRIRFNMVQFNVGVFLSFNNKTEVLDDEV